MKTHQFDGIHEEFVRVLQGASSLYVIGSDRINNADDYCAKHAKAMLLFESKELHPDTVKMYRNKSVNNHIKHVSGDGYTESIEYNGIKMTLIGSWIDLAAYYSGSDGNAWMFHTSTRSWVNQGECEEFKARLLANKIRGVLHGHWGQLSAPVS